MIQNVNLVCSLLSPCKNYHSIVSIAVFIIGLIILKPACNPYRQQLQPETNGAMVDTIVFWAPSWLWVLGLCGASAPCGLWGSKNKLAPFPGWIS